MKLIVSLVLSLVVVFGFKNFSSEKILRYEDCDSIPELNKKIIAFVTTKINKQVGRGECWDLAAESLNSNHAEWDGNYCFGKEINFKNECVYPGDIMQFEGVKIEYKEGNRSFIENLAHHTSIIYVTKSNSQFIVAEQNTSTSGKKVALNPLDLKNITKGKLRIFRPQP